MYYGTAPRVYLQSYGSGILVAGGSTATYTVTGLNSGVTYYFAITTVDSVKGIESAYSNEQSKAMP